MAIRNEALWQDIEEHPLMERCLKKDEAWKWLEKLQKGRRLTQLDLIQFKGLLDALQHQPVDGD